MTAFDQSITLKTSRSGAIDTARKTLSDAEQVIALREAPILIGLKGDWGYVFVAMANNPDVTELRLIVAKAGRVRDAFRAHAARQALELITQAPRCNDAHIRADAAARLCAIQDDLARADASVAAHPRGGGSGRSLLRRLAL
ncbi:MAG: hypothetical protein IT320_17095 [Anaerolineae bacterium]|nr:hypothetical protein [Anaerolineae bacterium]